MGDEDITSLTDLTGVDKEGGCVGAPMVIAVAHAGDGEGRGQVVFNGEAAGEPVGESVEAREPPTPPGLVWPGTVIGAVDHGG